MKFDEVINDIKKLVGIKISSIRAGADITLLDVNASDSCLELKDSATYCRSRPLSELRRIWEQLSLHKAVHVDSVLKGSGTSRNQPETILANLPYIEWLIIDGRKHISFVGKSTHTLGTLKQMDAMAAHALRSSFHAVKNNIPSVIIIADNALSTSSDIEGITGLSPIAKTLGVYAHNHFDHEVLVVNTSSMQQPLSPGAYIVINGKSPPSNTKTITIANTEYQLVFRNGINILIHVL